MSQTFRLDSERRYTLSEIRGALLGADALNAAEAERQAGHRAATIVNAAIDAALPSTDSEGQG